MVYIQRIRWESVRVGINNCVYTKLNQDIASLILIKCACHSAIGCLRMFTKEFSCC